MNARCDVIEVRPRGQTKWIQKWRPKSEHTSANLLHCKRVDLLKACHCSGGIPERPVTSGFAVPYHWIVSGATFSIEVHIGTASQSNMCLPHGSTRSRRKRMMKLKCNLYSKYHSLKPMYRNLLREPSKMPYLQFEKPLRYLPR